MLDRKSKIVLNTLIKNGFTVPKASFESIEKDLVPLLPNPKRYAWTFESVQPIIKYLIDCGYADGVSRTLGYYPVLDYIYVYATHKGQAYKEFSRMEVRSFFMRSILTPIVVSGLTALLVSFFSP